MNRFSMAVVGVLAGAALAGCADEALTGPEAELSRGGKKKDRGSQSVAACEMVTFNRFGNREVVRGIRLEELGATFSVSATEFTQGGGREAAEALTYDTDNVSLTAGLDTDLEWNGSFARCPDCEGLDKILLIHAGDPGTADNFWGGIFSFSGARPEDEFYIERFTVIDNDSNEPPVRLFVDGALTAESTPEGDGSVQVVIPNSFPAITSGFEIVSGTDRADWINGSGGIDNLNICRRVPAGECDGKVTRLTLQYTGSTGANIRVTRREGRDRPEVFEGFVAAGGTFEVEGGDRQGTLGTEIQLYVNGSLDAQIHTSCSQPIGPGLVKGSFRVISGESRNGGPLPPI